MSIHRSFAFRRSVRAFVAALFAWILTCPLPVYAQQAEQTSRQEQTAPAAPLVKLARARAAELDSPTGEALLRFYTERGGSPAWLREASFWRSPGPRREANRLIGALREADRFGLDPAHYPAEALERQLAALGSGASKGDALYRAELAFSEAFLLFARHLAVGRIDPTRLDLEIAWSTPTAEPDLLALLQRVFARSLDAAIQEAQPPQPEYRALLEALERYRAIAARGGWSPLPREADEPTLRRRLELEGFDERPLEAAVRAFQVHHGIVEDGVVGEETRAAFDVPVEARIEQIVLNLERWRWMPRSLGAPHVRVNIPGFELELRGARGERLLDMPVVVGQEGWGTPVLSEKIEYLVVNPHWNVPQSIAVEEILPAWEEDPDYLENNGFEIVSGGWDDAEVVDPESVDPDELAKEEPELRLRQRTGRGNALGRLKFMMPNDFDIYLHDTPAESLFEETERDHSHGCIRVAEPLELADALLRDDPQWNEAALRRAIESEERQVVQLPEPVPAHLMYWTALPREGGRLGFYRDLYEVDARLRSALQGLPSPIAARGALVIEGWRAV